MVPQRAVNVYVIKVVGATVVVPGVATPPMPLSISTASALVTAPQFNVTSVPRATELGDALNDAMLGVPEHADAVDDALEVADDEEDDDEDEDDELGGATLTTLILIEIA
jgi:hypothetical protein